MPVQIICQRRYSRPSFRSTFLYRLTTPEYYPLSLSVNVCISTARCRLPSFRLTFLYRHFVISLKAVLASNNTNVFRICTLAPTTYRELANLYSNIRYSLQNIMFFSYFFHSVFLFFMVCGGAMQTKFLLTFDLLV